VSGLQCHKRLWLESNRPKEKTPTPPDQQRIFDEGHAVGALARLCFPGGRLVQADHLHTHEALEETQALIRFGVDAIYEAAFLFDGVFAQLDVLVRVPGEKDLWDFHEVKSTLELKEKHLDDVAIQKYILEGAGLKVRRAHLMHMNRDYVRQGDIEPLKMFISDDVTEQVNEILKTVPAAVQRLKDVLSKDAVPDVEIGPHCTKPHPCPFEEQCWNDIPEYSVFDLCGRSAGKVARLRERGILLIKDIPDDFELDAPQRFQVQVEKTQEPVIDCERLTKMLANLRYPLYYLDFETVSTRIPPYDGVRPQQRIPFQVSIHIQAEPGGPLDHKEFLGDGNGDPRRSLAAFLLEAVGPQGSVVVYSGSFEGSCLAELARDFPDMAAGLRGIRARIWDLLLPFSRRAYVHPAFQGSASIKATLPALFPEMSYERLGIKEGNAASLAYLEIMEGRGSLERATQIRKDLLEYCGQDTLGMVKLLDFLTSVSQRGGRHDI
jgi:hypothetical protein